MTWSLLTSSLSLNAALRMITCFVPRMKSRQSADLLHETGWQRIYQEINNQFMPTTECHERPAVIVYLNYHSGNSTTWNIAIFEDFIIIITIVFHHN